MREPRPEVGARLGARSARDADRKPSGGTDPAAEHPGDGVRALLAREEGLHDRRGLGDGAAEGVRPPSKQHGDHGCPGVEDGVEQMLLRAGQGQCRDVAALAAGAASEESGAVAEDHQGDVGRARHPRGLVDAGEIRVVDAGTAGERDLRVGELRGERLAQGGQLDAEGRPRVADSDVLGEGVAAEDGDGFVGVGADEGDTARPVERQGAVVGQQHDGFLGERAGQGAVLRTVQVDPAAQGLRIVRVRPAERRRHEVPVRVEQAERHLLGEHPAYGAIDEFLRDAAVGDGFGQGVP
ncbi:hypothetical protein SHKM778_26360 [Streptomyces sp. KM77-8]|uniref:Uncharacterized protein n=1 Tax=Streptomyces haneummycinicus TaxID=3074435 RepID=A0AAT9HFI4_9ACTN